MQNMKIRYRIITGVIFSFVCVAAFGQKAERQRIREGNKLYNAEKFTESEIAYRKGVDVNPRSIEGAYDLGNALYRQQKFPEAVQQYQLVIGQKERLLEEDKQKNTNRLAQVYHNLGNIGMCNAVAHRNAGDIENSNKEYTKSIEAYKQSLRMNPADDETRYNLALAQKMLQNQQNQDQQQDQQQQQQEQQEQQQQQQDDQKEQKTQDEAQSNEQMSQDNAKQMLDAFLQDEKDTQEKVRKAQEKKQEQRRSDKQW
ncbi:MAG: tetratricopeptide repeat protein [Tannerella sp.]|nr:tetratricopeptide repeat protein [Tannerella sp.]